MLYQMTRRATRQGRVHFISGIRVRVQRRAPRRAECRRSARAAAVLSTVAVAGRSCGLRGAAGSPLERVVVRAQEAKLLLLAAQGQRGHFGSRQPCDCASDLLPSVVAESWGALKLS